MDFLFALRQEVSSTMKLFTIHPSDSSDTEGSESDEENWCTTTDTSIHSDLGSFLEDMALHEGDLSDAYDSDDLSESYGDSYNTSAEESESEAEESICGEHEDSTSEQHEVADSISEQHEVEDSISVTEEERIVDASQQTNASTASTYSDTSDLSELSDAEMADSSDAAMVKLNCDAELLKIGAETPQHNTNGVKKECCQDKSTVYHVHNYGQT